MVEIKEEERTRPPDFDWRAHRTRDGGEDGVRVVITDGESRWVAVVDEDMAAHAIWDVIARCGFHDGEVEWKTIGMDGKEITTQVWNFREGEVLGLLSIDGRKMI